MKLWMSKRRHERQIETFDIFIMRAHNVEDFTPAVVDLIVTQAWPSGLTTIALVPHVPLVEV